jgi:hypothetical protein
MSSRASRIDADASVGSEALFGPFPRAEPQWRRTADQLQIESLYRLKRTSSAAPAVD